MLSLHSLGKKPARLHAVPCRDFCGRTRAESFRSVEYLILGLATYRLTRLFTRDTILDSFRNWWWSKFPPEKHPLGYLLTCEWCLSFWVGSLVFVCYIISTATVLVVAPFALSAIAGLLTAYEDK